MKHLTYYFLFLFVGNTTILSQTNTDFLSEKTVQDIEGNVYPAVTIGNQIWMAENLKVTKYNNGDDIPLMESKSQWGEVKMGVYCWYKNDSSKYKDDYGALYNLYAVNTGMLCPVGWRVPTTDDWHNFVFNNWDTVYYYDKGFSPDSLSKYDPSKLSDLQEKYRFSPLADYIPIAPKLKDTSDKYWKKATQIHVPKNVTPGSGSPFKLMVKDLPNPTGFAARPGGARLPGGGYWLCGKNGWWWSSSNVGGYGTTFGIAYNKTFVNLSLEQYNTGVSVRCMTDL